MQILVEQSFSDYGDLDLLLLLDHRDETEQPALEGKHAVQETKHAVLIEAKVATAQGAKGIREEWESFLNYKGKNSKGGSSLFVQLGKKLGLVQRITESPGFAEMDPAAKTQIIGGNPIVGAATELLFEYAANAWYVALVPDTKEAVKTFFNNTIMPYWGSSNSEKRPWPLPNFGFLTWPDLHERCCAHKQTWPQTICGFRWNGIQIFRPPTASTVTHVKLGTYTFKSQPVVVLSSRAGDTSCRVAPAGSAGDFFPRTFTVAKGDLTPSSLPTPDTATILPGLGQYEWAPPAGEPFIPKGETATHMPPLIVSVVNAGPNTSRVCEVSEEDETTGDPFRVYNYHLRRPKPGPV